MMRRKDDPVERWWAEQKKIERRPVRVLPRKKLLMQVETFISPGSRIGKVFFPELANLAGRTFNAGELADAVGAAYNASIRQLSPQDGQVLMALLDGVPQHLIKDNEVARKASERIRYVFEQTSLRMKNVG